MMTSDIAVATLTRGGTAAPPKKGTIEKKETSRAKLSPTSTRKVCGLVETSKIRKTVSNNFREFFHQSKSKGEKGKSEKASVRFVELFKLFPFSPFSLFPFQFCWLAVSIKSKTLLLKVVS